MLLDSYIQNGLLVIKAVQKVTCVPLTVLGTFIHYVFNSPIYIMIMAFLFWCVDTKKAYKLSISMIFSLFINESLKAFLKVPRPYTVDPSVGRAVESTFSCPSGHSQSAATFFPLLAASIGKTKRWVRILIATVIPLLVGISRCYMGVHYPFDVLIGLGIGYAYAAGVMLFGFYPEKWLSKCRFSVKILIYAVLCYIANLCTMRNAAMSGLLLGIVSGYRLLTESKTGVFSAASGTRLQKTLRYLLGLVITVIVYIGLKFVLPGEESSLYHLCRFGRYFVTGFVLTYLLPKLFVKLNLAEELSE